MLTSFLINVKCINNHVHFVEVIYPNYWRLDRGGIVLFVSQSRVLLCQRATQSDLSYAKPEWSGSRIALLTTSQTRRLNYASSVLLYLKIISSAKVFRVFYFIFIIIYSVFFVSLVPPFLFISYLVNPARMTLQYPVLPFFW